MATWLWETADWPPTKFDASALLSAVSNARRAQGEVMGMARALGLEEARNVQARIWAGESLATAAIEGENLNLDSLRSSIARRLGLDGGAPSRDRPVEGLLDMMQDAVDGWDKPIVADRLLGWQNALFPAGFSSIHRVAAGKYRTHAAPMQIVSGRLGREKVHYEAPPSKQVPKEMNRLITWLNRGSENLDGLLRAGIAHLWFESIHPFEDGNGRVGRALVDWSLASDMRSGHRLYSVAAELSLSREDYYAELNAASRAGADPNRWLRYFLGVFEKACARSTLVMQAALTKARFWSDHPDELKPWQRKVVNLLLDAGPRGFEGDLSARKYISLTKLPRPTASRELADLVAKGILASYGERKGTKYHLNLPGWEPGEP
jgi:Fic family protein